MGWEIHGAVEESYHAHPAGKGDGAAWLDKQRLLLADMAVHLLQTAVAPGEIELEKLRNNLNAILVVADRFLPDAALRNAADKLYPASDRGKAAPR
ncbi:hypothetical protein [Massilia sp. ST3]|uniref:hypothetical protein n=1 Tax=Massilia sp. ST3 TaxID=2824903 RepID=UPI001B81907E|nr:hypothetical protein [Massilia sp. ST3]MBQ5949153.1 hypothetical protein [Massilia sp. ST3]